MNANNELPHGVDPEIRLPKGLEKVVAYVSAAIISVGLGAGIYFHNKKFEEIACRQRAAVKKCLDAEVGGKERIKDCANSNLVEGDVIRNDHEFYRRVKEVASGEEEGVCEEAPAD